MNSNKVRNKLVERVYLKPKTKKQLIYKVGLKLYKSEDYSLTEYVLHLIDKTHFILLNTETLETKRVIKNTVHTSYNLSKKMVATEIRAFLNKKLLELSELEADEYTRQFYGTKQEPKETRDPDFSYKRHSNEGL